MRSAPVVALGRALAPNNSVVSRDAPRARA